MKVILIGVGAAGNKAVKCAIERGTVDVEDTIIINSTTKDFPEGCGKSIVLAPKDSGCGKEREVAKDYTISAIKAGKFNIDEVKKYDTIVMCTSVEGGTGSGSTPILARFFNQVYRKNVHVIAFTGFEEDVRGLANTVEFFKEIDSKLIVQTIRNNAFLKRCGGNKFKAEEAANEEMCKRIDIISGKNFISSRQNIDDTDILKVSNTSGYMTVENISFDKSLVDQDEFNRIVKKMIYDSKSVKAHDPGAVRLGIILNIDPGSEDAIDYSFADIKSAYGNPYECFLQQQWDSKKEYIALIASGMQMPLAEIAEVYEKYKEESSKVTKTADEFFKEMQDMVIADEDKKFDMIKKIEQGSSAEDFLKSLETGNKN